MLLFIGIINLLKGGFLVKIKKLLSILLIASTAFIVSACGNSKSTASNGDASNSKIKDGGNIVFSIGGDPQALNPLYASDRVTMTINNALFSPLFVMNGEKIDYYLASEVKHSDDYLTYTLKLKKDLKWHDDKPITADDVVFTMEKLMDKNQNSLFRDLFVINDTPIQVKKIDDITVEFKLPSVQMAFMSSLSQISPIPKHLFDGETNLAKSQKNDKPIGSGPFKFKEAKKGESVTLQKFDGYVGGKPHLDTVTYRILGDKSSGNAALENGEISATYVIPQNAERFQKNENLQIVTYEEGMVDSLLFNCTNPNLSKKEVRQALSYALNKEDLIKAAYESEKFATKAYTIFTPDTLFYSNDVNKYEQNKDKAKELLKKSGVENLKLNLVYINSDKGFANAALVVQQNLKDIGVTIELKPLEPNAFYSKVFEDKNGDFDLTFNGYVCGNEPDGYKQSFLTDQMFNGSKYSNKQIDELWSKGVTETDKKKREKIYKDIQKQILDDAPLYPIAYSKSIIAISKKIGGVKEAKPAPIFMFQDLSKLYMIEK